MGSYMLLFNVCAANGQGDDSARVRISTKEEEFEGSPRPEFDLVE